MPVHVYSGSSASKIISGGGDVFLKLEDGVTNLIFPEGYEGINGWMQHDFFPQNADDNVSEVIVFPCQKDHTTGKGDCPGCTIGDKPTPRFISVVLVRGENGDLEEKVFAYGRAIYNELVKIFNLLGEDFGDKVLSLSKTGKGLGTRYAVMPTGKNYKGDVEITIDPVTYIKDVPYDEILEMFRKEGLWNGNSADDLETIE